jgi:Ni/Fe-hydrogenase 1 B-type cytochrome subunit
MSVETSREAAVGTPALAAHAVWDRPTRWLHWLNALLSLLVIGMGLLFMFRKDLRIEGAEAKLSIMSAHSVLGYCLAVGVGARIAWGFFGNVHVRFASVLPRAGTWREALREGAAIASNRPYRHDVGHGALGRLSTTAMLGLFLLMFASGAFQAGIDLKHPPLWNAVAGYVAKPGVPASRVELKNAEVASPEKVAKVRKLRTVAVRTHSFASYALMALLVLHVAGVLLKETRHGGALLSSMITGRKIFADPPRSDDGKSTA